MCFNCTTYNLIFKKRKLKRFREPTISFILLLLSQICGGSDIGCQPLCEWGWRRRRRSAKWDIRTSNWVFTTEGVSLFGGSFIGDTHSPKRCVPFLPCNFLQQTLLLNSWCLLFGIFLCNNSGMDFSSLIKVRENKESCSPLLHIIYIHIFF